ncbi:DUF91 domain-containing protein [archaeon]|nr:DUF91 domain-containing protein [archaeon]
MRSHVEPDFETAKNVLEHALRRRELITLYCECMVKYEGRAYSKLERGERVVTIKQDNTLLVHKPTGRNPINWIKEGASIKFKTGDALVITAESINPREHMMINISKVNLLVSAELSDAEEVSIVGSEADMARMIYEKPYLISDDFKPVSLEEQTKYGFIDVMGHNGKGTLVIIECKRVTAGLNAVQQLRRYVEKIKKVKGVKKVVGYIAAPGMSKNAEGMLKDWGYKFARVEPPNRNIVDKSRQQKLKKYLKSNS